MQDLSQLSDEQLMQMADAQSAQAPVKQDLSSFSDEQLQSMLGQQQQEDPGLLARIADAVTGNSRKTSEIEALPDWRGNMPEFSLAQGLPALKTALGTMATGPEETAKIIKANYPEVQVRQDEKGNYIFKSNIDQNEYALKPGLRWSDAPRGLAQILMMMPAAKATSILGAGLAAGATQAAIEGTQAATGGEFNPSEVGLAAGMGSAGEIVGRILGAAIPGAKRLIAGKGFIPEEIAATVPVISKEAADADLEALVNKAASENLSANKYKRLLAERAKIDPAAYAALDELGIPAPPDLASDTPQLRAIVGAGRSIRGSEAQAAWREVETAAVDRIDNLISQAELDTPTSTVSENVKKALQSERDALKAQTKAAYDEVDNAVAKKTVISKPVEKVPVAELSAEERQLQQLNESIAKATGKYKAPVEAIVETQGPGMPHLEALLKQTIENQGGIKGLTSQERGLFDMLKNDTITYDRLMREKSALRGALRGKQTPYSNLDQSIVERLYNAIREDQHNAIRQIGGQELGDRLVSADLLYTKQKQVEKTLIDAFGRDLNKSLVPAMRATVKLAKEGIVPAFNKMLQTVPTPLQREAVASALLSSASKPSGEKVGKIGLTQFKNTWSKIKQHPEIFSKIEKTLGADTFKLFSNIAVVGNLIERATSELSANGASNQAILRSMRANTLTDRLLDKTVLSFIGGSVGGGIGAAIASTFARAPKDRVAAAAKMFNSPEFQAIVTDVMKNPSPSKSAVEGFAKSSAFSKFAALAKLPTDPKSKIRWVKAALMSQPDMAMPQAAFQPDKTIAEVLPNGTVKSDPTTKFKIVQKPGGKFRLLSPDGKVSVFNTEDEAIRSATRQLRVLTNSPLK